MATGHRRQMLKMLSELCILCTWVPTFFASIIYFLQLGVRHGSTETGLRPREFSVLPLMHVDLGTIKLRSRMRGVCSSEGVKTNDNKLLGSTRITVRLRRTTPPQTKGSPTWSEYTCTRLRDGIIMRVSKTRSNFG
jgi:hypothetical protein